MSFAQSIQRSLARPKTCIFGWGMSGFGLLAGIGMSLGSFVFSDEFTTRAKIILSIASILGFMLGGIVWGTIMWFLFGKKLRDRLPNKASEATS